MGFVKNFAEWKHLGTLVVLGLASWLGTICLLGWQLYWDVYTPDLGIQDSLKNHLTEAEGEGQKVSKTLEDIVGVLGEIRADQQEAYKRDLTIRGQGAAGSFGGSEKYVRINQDSDASLYRDGDMVRITKIADEGRASEVFEVRGEWTHPDPAVLVSFSQAACEVLEVTGIIKVQLEPVLKK